MLESNWSFNSSPRVLHHFLYHRVVEDGAIQHSFPTFKLRAIISTLINIGRHEKIRLPQSCAVLTKTAKSFGIVQNNRGLGGMVTQCLAAVSPQQESSGFTTLPTLAFFQLLPM